jgi:hypothetical protein
MTAAPPHSTTQVVIHSASAHLTRAHQRTLRSSSVTTDQPKQRQLRKRSATCTTRRGLPRPRQEGSLKRSPSSLEPRRRFAIYTPPSATLDMTTRRRCVTAKPRGAAPLPVSCFITTTTTLHSTTLFVRFVSFSIHYTTLTPLSPSHRHRHRHRDRDLSRRTPQQPPSPEACGLSTGQTRGSGPFA